MNLSVKNIYKNFENLRVLENITMDFEKEKITCILGPSGCGKTTLLNIISGIDKDFEGEITGIEGENIAYVFQEDRLIPWKSVYENMEYVLKSDNKKDVIKDVINKYLQELELEEFKNYFPSKLSGGMKSRVSIGRAFCYNSEILIMDEPFKSLDTTTKEQVEKLLLRVLKNNKKTVILVTHNIEEACRLGDNIFVLSQKPTVVKYKLKNDVKNYDKESIEYKEFYRKIECMI